jgi:hypothetical protein
MRCSGERSMALIKRLKTGGMVDDSCSSFILSLEASLQFAWTKCHFVLQIFLRIMGKGAEDRNQ